MWRQWEACDGNFTMTKVTVIQSNLLCIPRMNNPKTAVLLSFLPNLNKIKLWKITYQWRVCEELSCCFSYGILTFLLRLAHSCTKAPAAQHRLGGQLVAAGRCCYEPYQHPGRLLAVHGRNGNGQRCALLWYKRITYFVHYDDTDTAPNKS